jgi:hypothetical protein
LSPESLRRTLNLEPLAGGQQIHGVSAGGVNTAPRVGLNVWIFEYLNLRMFGRLSVRVFEGLNPLNAWVPMFEVSNIEILECWKVWLTFVLSKLMIYLLIWLMWGPNLWYFVSMYLCICIILDIHFYVWNRQVDPWCCLWWWQVMLMGATLGGPTGWVHIIYLIYIIYRGLETLWYIHSARNVMMYIIVTSWWFIATDLFSLCMCVLCAFNVCAIRYVVNMDTLKMLHIQSKQRYKSNQSNLNKDTNKTRPIIHLIAEWRHVFTFFPLVCVCHQVCGEYGCTGDGYDRGAAIRRVRAAGDQVSWWYVYNVCIHTWLYM